MSSPIENEECYVLIMKGKHHMTFKAKNKDQDYLIQLAETTILESEGHYFEYEIHASSHSNTELTAPEFLLHLTVD